MMSRIYKNFCVFAAVCLLATVFCAFAFGESAAGAVANAPSYITPGTTVKNRLSSAGDYEEYLLTVDSAGALQIELSHVFQAADTTGAGWSVTLYQVYCPDGISGSALRELAVSEFKISDSTTVSTRIGVYKGTYLVRVEPLSVFTGNQYGICVNFTSSAVWEDEYNDTSAYYSEIPLNTVLYGTTSERSDTASADSDWYMFTVPENGTAIISFDHAKLSTTRGSWLVEITDLSGRSFASFTSKPTDTRVNTGNLGLKPGNYLLSVEPILQENVEYSIYIFYMKNDIYELEFNDTPETATPLLQGVKTYASLSTRFLELDKDYFIFSVPENGLVSLNFSRHLYEADTGGWNIRIYDANQTELYHRIAKYENISVDINNLGLPAGTYYICIDADGQALSNDEYALLYTLAAAADAETEPNDTLLTADVITPDTAVTGALVYGSDRDDDYYTFTLAKAQSVSVLFTHDQVAPGDSTNGIKDGWKITLYDAQGNALATETKSRWNTTSVQTTAQTLPAGTYYVSVQLADYGSELPYKLTVKTVS